MPTVTIAILSGAIGRAIEARDNHRAAHRYRRQELIYSTCSDLVERAERPAAQTGAAA